MLDEYFESASALEAMGAGSGDFFTLSQRPNAALILQDDTTLNGNDDDEVFASSQDNQAGKCLNEFSNISSIISHLGWASGG